MCSLKAQASRLLLFIPALREIFFFLLPSMSIKPGSGCALWHCTRMASLVPNLDATMSLSRSQRSSSVRSIPALGLASLLHPHPDAKATGVAVGTHCTLTVHCGCDATCLRVLLSR